MLLTFKSGGFAIIIYAFTLIITLVTTKMDDKLSLYQHNSTLFDRIDDSVSIITLTISESWLRGGQQSLIFLRSSIPKDLLGGKFEE